MKELVTPFKVGLLVIISVISFIWTFGQVREGVGENEAGYEVYAIFDDVGLAEKSRVTIAGINVGQIKKIELAGTEAKVWLLVTTPQNGRPNRQTASEPLRGVFSPIDTRVLGRAA